MFYKVETPNYGKNLGIVEYCCYFEIPDMLTDYESIKLSLETIVAMLLNSLYIVTNDVSEDDLDAYIKMQSDIMFSMLASSKNLVDADGKKELYKTMEKANEIWEQGQRNKRKDDA